MENWKNGQLIGTEPDPEPEEQHPVPPTIEEQILALQNALITSKISGGGITTITDSSENHMKNFSLIGKSEQITTTGAQLFDWKSYLTTVGSKEQFKEKLLEGYTVLRGIAVNTSVIQYGMQNQVAMCMKVKSDTQYFFGGYKKSNIVFLNDSLDIVGNSDRATFLTTADTAYIVMYIFNYAQGPNQQVYTLSEIKEMNIIGYGAVVKPYEPHTGGKPSPSPDYPQEIKNVGKWNVETQKYEVNIKVSGKNLINEKSLKNFENYIKQGTTYYVYRIRGLIIGAQYTLSRGDARSGNKMIFGISVNGQSYDNSNFLVYDGLGTPYNRKSITWTQSNVDYADILFTYNSNQSQTTAERLKELFDRVEYIQLEYGKSPTAHEVLKKSQSVILTSDRPITKWDKLVEKDGQIGWLYGGKIIESYNSETIDTEYISSTGELSVGATVLYRLKEAEFILLPKEEQDAIRALKTYYPTTVITTDGGEVDSDIEATYIADTKNYIDQKIAAIGKTVVETQKALL